MKPKTPSQRMRNVLFLLFEQDHKGFSDFDSFYLDRMEKLIDLLKKKLTAPMPED